MALLWTLAVLILTLTATLSVAQLAATAAAHRGFDRAEDSACVLLPAAEAAIVDWLQQQSSKVVLPPDSEQPRIQVLDDLIVVDDRRFRLTITAFDQCGMMPLRAVINGSPLRLALDDEALRIVDASNFNDESDDEPLGLDQLTILHVSGRKVFPRPAGDEEISSQRVVFIAPDAKMQSSIGPAAATPVSDAEIPLGALLATHAGGTGPINVNTAPAWVLEAALRQAGRGGLDQILDNRTAGRSSPVPQVAAGAQPSEQSLMPTFVSASDLWAFRIDARCALRGGEGTFVGSSWWAVYQRTSSSWKCVQRLAITD